jgi:hypothetical protein
LSCAPVISLCMAVEQPTSVTRISARLMRKGDTMKHTTDEIPQCKLEAMFEPS